MNLNLSDLAYLAALLDSEGCLSYSRRPNGSAYPRVLVEMTHEGVLQWARQTTGLGGNISKRQRKTGNKPVFRWTVCTQEAVRLLRAVQPQLKIKQRQAVLLLELGHITHARPGGPKLTPDEVWAHNLIVSLVRSLNKRGT